MTAFRRLAPVVACIALTACGGGKKPESQVAVKVNGNELSVHQVNAQLARMNGVPPAQQDLVRKQVVEGLIDQQLLIQQATDKKLDRDPDVLAAIEQSRAQILAQAYVQKALSVQAKPGAEMVKKYYADNPALFSQRRVFRLQELATDLPPERAEDLKAVAAQSKSLPEVASWLQKQKFQVAANTAVRGAEQLPMSQVGAISAMKDGEIGVFVADRKVTVLQVVASQPQPLDEAKATPLIEQFLAVRARDELARAELKRLRDGAKIEYVGDFIKLAKLTPDDMPQSVATAAPPAPAPAASASASVDKGVAGLK